MARLIVITLLALCCTISQAQSGKKPLSTKELKRCAGEAEILSFDFYVPDELNQLESLIRAKNPELSDKSLMELFQEDSADLEIDLPFESEDSTVWLQVLNDFADRFEAQLMETSCKQDFAMQMVPQNPAYWRIVAGKHWHLDHLYGLANLALIFVENISPHHN